MLYGKELEQQILNDIAKVKQIQADRQRRIDEGSTDYEDCFVSMAIDSMCDKRQELQLEILRNGGYAYFVEFATLDGELCSAKLCDTKYGLSWRVETPSGNIIWTTATTAKGLARKGLKNVLCKRAAWVKYICGSGSGLAAAVSGTYATFPSSVNYATGEAAEEAPIEIKDIEQ